MTNGLALEILPPMADGDILVLGATGRVGAPMVAHLCARGLPVRALVRDAGHAASLLPATVKLVEGDLRDHDAIEHAARGCRRIAFVAGVNGLAGRGSSHEIEFAAVSALAEAVRDTQMDRFLLLSSAGVTQPEHPHNCTFGSVLSCKRRGEEALRASGVPHVILRALGLRDLAGGTQGVRMVQGDRIAFGEVIARDDLAAMMADIADPAGGRHFAAEFDQASLTGATFEVFNDAAIPGGTWNHAHPALQSDGAG